MQFVPTRTVWGAAESSMAVINMRRMIFVNLPALAQKFSFILTEVCQAKTLRVKNTKKRWHSPWLAFSDLCAWLWAGMWITRVLTFVSYTGSQLELWVRDSRLFIELQEQQLCKPSEQGWQHWGCFLWQGTWAAAPAGDADVDAGLRLWGHLCSSPLQGECVGD